MKMKEVIAQTGLTDRAVRLYMEQGLISPSCAENYNGRKSIDFSSQDVTQLQNIALLRRADFSVAEIRRMLQNAADVPLALREYMDRERQQTEHKESILRALDALPLPESATAEDVCRCIEAAARSGAIPPEDLEPLPQERKSQQSFFRFGFFLIATSVTALAALPFLWHTFYRYFYATSDGWRLALFEYQGWLILIAAGVLFMLCNRRKSPVTPRRKRMGEIGVLLSIVLCILTAFSTLLSFGMTQPFFASRTTDPAHYGKPDKHVRDALIPQWFPDGVFDAVFPQELPPSARLPEDRLHLNNASFPVSTQYYYYYSDCIDASFDVVAQWTLSAQDYTQARSAVPQNANQTVQKGEWTCLYYADAEPEDWQNATYAILIFAFNDRTRSVRYIASFNEQMIYAEGPYYLQLDW